MVPISFSKMRYLKLDQSDAVCSLVLSNLFISISHSFPSLCTPLPLLLIANLTSLETKIVPQFIQYYANVN